MTRSDSRAKADPLKKDTLSLGTGNTMSRAEDLSDEDPRDIARALLAEFGWSEDQFGCLDSLWTRESNWNVHADNPHVLGLRHPAGAPRLQDVLGRRRLGQQRRHPDPLGPRLHPGPLRLALLRLGPQPEPRLVLSRPVATSRRVDADRDRRSARP